MTISFFVFAGLFAFAGLIVPLPSACFLLPVVLNIIKPFHIEKPVISVDNTTVIKTLKGTIWIAKVVFSSLNKAWQYMLCIPNPAERLEVAKDVSH